MSELTCQADLPVTLVKASAADVDVISAARVSTMGTATLDALLPPERVDGLINFLMRDRHGTPFEHNSMTFLVRVPIFVAREFMRHRVGMSYNEESGRYRKLLPIFYVPDAERKLVQVGKAGAYTFEAGTRSQHVTVQEETRRAYEVAWEAYTNMLMAGVAREVARVVLPVGIYTSFYVTCNARSLMHFLGLRTTHEAARVPSFPQREIELVAEKMEQLWAGLMPVTHAAFNANGRVAP